MCGIAGSINFVDKKVDEGIIPLLTKSIKHRGPDHSGFWLSNNHSALMINTRLSILDLSRNGNQPFFSNDKRFVIVFNGEIYNFRNLKKKIKRI